MKYLFYHPRQKAILSPQKENPISNKTDRDQDTNHRRFHPSCRSRPLKDDNGVGRAGLVPLRVSFQTAYTKTLPAKVSLSVGLHSLLFSSTHFL